MREKVILVIDDDEMNLQIAKMILERKLPCKVIGVNNGVDGIEILKSQRVNLVLLDIMMPDFDGIETLQEIRNDELIKDVPVIMLTASGDIDDIKKTRMLGVKEYIKKPFLPADLLIRVEKKLAEEIPCTEVLLIGDEDDERRLNNLKEVIENNFHHDVLIAAGYEETIKVLSETKMSLIIICADMSFIDGFRILAFVAGDKKFKKIPFAVTTPDKVFRLIDKINQLEVLEPPEVEESPAEEPPVEESPVEEEEETAIEGNWAKPSDKEKPPLIKEVAHSPVARSDKKKLANVVTTLIGYDLDLKV